MWSWVGFLMTAWMMEPVKRWVDIITGNISSYSRVVNSQAHLDLAVEANDIAAVIGEIRADNEEGMQARATKKKTTDAVHEAKRNDAIRKAEEKKAALAESLIVLAKDVVHHRQYVKNLKI
jgi:hypothetical protein